VLWLSIFIAAAVLSFVYVVVIVPYLDLDSLGYSLIVLVAYLHESVVFPILDVAVVIFSVDPKFFCSLFSKG